MKKILLFSLLLLPAFWWSLVGYLAGKMIDGYIESTTPGAVCGNGPCGGGGGGGIGGGGDGTGGGNGW